TVTTTAAPMPPETVTTASAATAEAATTATAMAATAAVSDELYVGLACPNILLVEDIERCQGDVRDFLLTKCEVVILAGLHCRDICWADWRCRCPARQRQRQSRSA